KDVEMALELEEIRLRRSALKGGYFDSTDTDAEYARAFADYGVAVMEVSLEEAAHHLRSRSVVEELAVALDDWANVCDMHNQWDKARRLFALAAAVDPDPSRGRMREAILKRAVKTFREEFKLELVARLRPATAILLARGAARANLPKAMALLHEARNRYPNDFWINHELGSQYLQARPPQTEEAIRFLTAASVLRPTSPGVHHNLGLALAKRGAWAEAATMHQRATDLAPDYAVAHGHLAIAYSKQGAWARAAAAYRKYQQFDPG